MNARNTPPQNTDIDTGPLKGLETISELYLINLPPNVITTTEDKVRLCLSEHLKKMERKKSWVTPLGILLALIATLITTNFKDMGLTAPTWQAIFIIAAILSFVWLIYSIREALRSEKVEDIVRELKRHSRSMIKFARR